MDNNLRVIPVLLVVFACVMPPVMAEEPSAVEIGVSAAQLPEAAESGVSESEAALSRTPETDALDMSLYEAPELDLSGRLAISLEDALQLVSGESYGARTARAGFERSRFDLDLALAPFDTVFSLRTGHSSSERQGASALLTSNSVSSSKSTYYKVDLSRRFPSGDSFSVSQELSRSRISQSGAGAQTIPRSYSGSVDLAWTHPLGRGLGRDATWVQVRQTLNRQLSEQLALDDALRTLRYETFALYYALVAQHQALDVRRANLESAIHFLKRSYERHKVGLGIRADVLQAENNVLNQKTRMIEAQKLYIDSLDKLSLLLGVRQPLAIRPDLDLEPGPVTVDLDVDWPRTRLSSAALKRAETDLRNTELAVGFLQSETRPDLALTLNYGRAGEAGAASTAMRNLDDETYSLVLSYTLPWEKRAHKSRLSQAGLDLEIAKVSLEQASQQLHQDWQGLFRELESRQAQLELAESNVEVARENYEIQVERNEVGLATTYDVIRAQESFLESQLAHLYAQVDYQTAYLQILTMTGDI